MELAKPSPFVHLLNAKALLAVMTGLSSISMFLLIRDYLWWVILAGGF
jgi:hypothetical protein